VAVVGPTDKYSVVVEPDVVGNVVVPGSCVVSGSSVAAWSPEMIKSFLPRTFRLTVPELKIILSSL